MDADFFHAHFLGHGQETQQMIDMAVDAPITEESQEMELFSSIPGFFHGFHQDRILFQAAVFHGPADPGQALVDDPAGTDGQVSHFRIAHLAFRKPHRFPGTPELAVGIPVEVIVQMRSPGPGHRIGGAGRCDPPAVQDHQHHRFLSHGTPQKVLAMAQNSWADRLAPPTRTPSMPSSWKAWAFSLVTLPP